MKKIQLVANSIVLFFISFLLISCNGTATTSCNGAATTADSPKELESSHHPNTPDNSQKIESEKPNPIIEIWQDLDGSVAIRGKSLHFRMYDDGVVEFDYQSRKENASGRPRYTYSIERTTPDKISEEELRKIKSLLDDLTKSKDIKQEYKGVGLTLDVLTTLTILLNENGNIKRKIIINDADYDVTSSIYEKKFPNLLVTLLKEVHLIRLGKVVVDYEPAVVELEGRLGVETFFGPPNFGEDPETDSKERSWIVSLSRPINVRGIADSDLGLHASVEDVRELQLVLREPRRDLIGKKVIVEGTLFHAHTGHHHTEVLMDVQSIRLGASN